jgi:DNA-directed RNA polymerase sigma subunit (sigma70/sigma32)
MSHCDAPRYGASSDDAARTPTHPQMADLRVVLTATAASLASELGRSPRPTELAERAQVRLDDVVETLARYGPVDDLYVGDLAVDARDVSAAG